MNKIDKKGDEQERDEAEAVMLGEQEMNRDLGETLYLYNWGGADKMFGRKRL